MRCKCGNTVFWSGLCLAGVSFWMMGGSLLNVEAVLRPGEAGGYLAAVVPPERKARQPRVISVVPERRPLPALLLRARERLMEEKRDFIDADLTGMKLYLYRKGEVLKTYRILVKGKEGSWGQTPGGLFDIKRKEEAHFSSLGQVYMPYNLTFHGNYSIHGWPYYPDGALTSRSFSSGCINLSSEDAADLYRETPMGLPILVRYERYGNDGSSYAVPRQFMSEPAVAARAYLAADLENGFTFSSRNGGAPLPLFSVAGLMNALVASEYNLLSFNSAMTAKVRITPAMTAPDGEVANLVPGKTFTYFDLLYPLLLGASDDAAEALASTRGRERFIGFMNARAQSLGMDATRFVDPGSRSPANVATANDLYVFAKYLSTSRPWLFDITRGKIFKDFGSPAFAGLGNGNLFSHDKNFIGGKAGRGSDGRQTVFYGVAVGESGVRGSVVIAVLDSPGAERDTLHILRWLEEYASAV